MTDNPPTLTQQIAAVELAARRSIWQWPVHSV